MKYPIVKAAAVLGVAATLMAAVATPSDARERWVGPAAGFAAGVIVGSAIANQGYYYGYPYDPYYGVPAQTEPYASTVYPGYPAYPYGYRYKSQPCTSDTNVGRQDSGC